MSNYQLTWLNSAADIPEAIWLQCFPPPYEGQWWYLSLERAGLQDQFTFIYGLLTLQEVPVAIVPAFIMNVPISLVVPPAILPIVQMLGKVFPSLLYQRTFFVGSPCSDEGRVGVVNQHASAEMLAFINQSVQQQADAMGAPMRVWKDFEESYLSAFDAFSAKAGLFRMVSFPGASLELQGKSFNDYLASVKSSRRNKIKKKLKSAAQVAIDVEVVRYPNATQMDEIFALFWQTYEKGDTKFERLNRQFFTHISDNPYAYYIVMREQNSGDMLGFMLCFLLADHVVNKFIGLDYKKPKEWFLYFRLWQAAVDWCYQVGAKSIQSGQTGYAPKIELGNRLVPMYNFCRHRNPIVHWIYALVARTINWDTLDEDLQEYVAAYPDAKPKI